jgi:hypothetical protein
MAVDQNRLIWGVGCNKTEARKEALKNVDSYRRGYLIGNPHSEKAKEVFNIGPAIVCDHELFDKVYVHGADETTKWRMKNGVASLVTEIKKRQKKSKIKKQKKEFKKLNTQEALESIYSILQEIRDLLQKD